jgi:hypothetical protein
MVGPMNDIALLLGARALAVAVVAASAALASWPAAAAGELPDPTRPPLALRRTTTGPGPIALKPAPPVLQSVMTGAGRRPSVIISGRTLELGDSFDDMKLTKVSETGAVLSGSRGTTTLALTPGSDKSFASVASVERLAAAPPALQRGATVPLALRAFAPEEK